MGHMIARPDWSMRAHLHAHHEMIVMLRGRQYVEIGGQDLAVDSGGVLLYPQGVAHAERTDSRQRHEGFFFSFTWSGYRPDMPVNVTDRRGRLAALAAWLYQERDAAGRTAALARGRFLAAILAEFVRLVECPAYDMPSKIRDYVRAHLSEPLSLDLLAVRAGLSKFHFLRRYKRLTGLSPMADVRRIRMEVARNLLMSSDLPLKAIAPRVGLANEYHLSRLLKKHLGTGARELRRYQ
jgi:AraC-like DNA-binding protein